jgi:D-beta-D-heptose 7-phosphate kinase/D-beta-D-heptose 1-phosphate adenosyltransferase
MPLNARAIFDRARGRGVLVVGDVMLDEWIWGTVSRISPEAPVPVVAVSDHSFTLGGAGNVVKNLRALGADVTFAATVGEDAFAAQVRALLGDSGVDGQGIFALDGRPTTRKTRVVAHHQQVVRADWESTVAPPAGQHDRIVEFVRERAKKSDAVILSDYGKGLLSRPIVEAALGCELVLVDPKPQNAALFRGVTCIAPNLNEASAITGIAGGDDRALESIGTQLLDRLNCRYAVITRGEHGMALFGNDCERLQVASAARTVFDVSGAGDTVVATLGVALAAGAPIAEAVRLANFAAGAVVEKLGTATASPEEILALVAHDVD